MFLGSTIRYRFGHWIRLVPNDVLPQPPTICLKGKCHTPRDAYEILVLQTLLLPAITRNDCWHVPLPTDCLWWWSNILLCHVGIAKIQPQSSIETQTATNFAEYIHHCLDIFLDFLFGADLAFASSVITQTEVCGEVTQVWTEFSSTFLSASRQSP